MALLHIADLHRRFHGVSALAGATFSVEAGTITGLIGPNGAGKTTLFNIVSGLIAPDEGRVELDGRDIAGEPAEAITRRGLVRTFQIARGFPRLTVMENLLLYGTDQPGERIGDALLGFARARRRERDLVRRAAVIAERLSLTRVLDHRAGEISGGQKKLLELGRALMTGPRMILLDEPVAGVNPTLAESLAGHLRELRDEGHTLLVIEHDMNLIAKLCDPVVVLADGMTLTEGSFDAIAADPRVQAAYMGRRAGARPGAGAGAGPRAGPGVGNGRT